MNKNTRTTTRFGILIAAAMLALSGCAVNATPTAEPPHPAGEVVTITDEWVKSADSGMSAAFGELVNSGDNDVTVVSVTSAASSMLELHETVENEAGEIVMRELESGFVIPAGGSLSLAPGANHIMMMNLTAPLLAGEEVEFTLTFSDDSIFSFTAPVKDYSGANETYDGGDSEKEMDH